MACVVWTTVCDDDKQTDPDRTRREVPATQPRLRQLCHLKPFVVVRGRNYGIRT